MELKLQGTASLQPGFRLPASSCSQAHGGSGTSGPLRCTTAAGAWQEAVRVRCISKLLAVHPGAGRWLWHRPLLQKPRSMACLTSRAADSRDSSSCGSAERPRAHPHVTMLGANTPNYLALQLRLACFAIWHSSARSLGFASITHSCVPTCASRQAVCRLLAF